jgi:hypothetical protein
MESKSHKTTANRIARKLRTEYNSGEGADVVSNNMVVEIETETTVNGGLNQLRGYQKPVYIAGTNKKAVEKALQTTKGTTVGVMNNQGKVIKRSTRKKRK